MPFPDEPTPPVHLPAEPEPTPFEKFERLTKRLLRVPKKEIDRTREREKRKDS